MQYVFMVCVYSLFELYAQVIFVLAMLLIFGSRVVCSTSILLLDQSNWKCTLKAFLASIIALVWLP